MTSSAADDRPGTACPDLRKDRDRFAALSFCWADVVLELDAAGRILYGAGLCEQVLGAPADDLIGGALSDRIAIDSRHTLAALYADTAPRGRVIDPAMRLVGDDGTIRTAACCAFRLGDLAGHAFIALRGRAGHGADQAKPAEGDRDLALDPDSGLLAADAFAEDAAHRLVANGSGPASKLSLISLSGYEALHRRLGAAGERILAASLGTCLRASTVDPRGAGRLGFDRYGLLHTAELDLDGLEQRLMEITRQQDPAALGATAKSTTLAIAPASGGAGDVGSPEEVASGLLYALNRFRNAKGTEFTLKSLSGSLGTLARDAFKAVETFKLITANADFDVLFQPIVDARTGVIHHYEALARFPSVCGSRSPFEQITFAEEVGLIGDFDVAMTRRVLDWLATGRALNGTTRVAVNVSGQTISSVDSLAALDALLQDNRWARGRLMFEITESAHLGNLVAANAFVQRLRRQGFPVCLDDFGAGAANFEYLSSLEIDIVKLDGAAIRGARTAHKGKAFLKALVGLCRDLGVVTVAEMIEDEAALKFVRDCGVHYVQGYLFGKPGADIGAFRRAIPSRLFPSADTGLGSRRVAAGRRG